MKLLKIFLCILSFPVLGNAPHALHAFRRIGQTLAGIDHAKNVLINTQGTILQSLFSPDDKPKQVLLGLIEAEQERISMAAYLITDHDIAQALMKAHTRGVIIEIVTESTNLYGQWSKCATLHTHGIPLFIFQPSVRDAIMHNKFIVFNKSINNKSIVWTGSFNFSRAAAYKNQENIIVIDNTSTVTAYKNHFEKLKQRSMLLEQ